MEQPDHGAEPKFTRPFRQIVTMLVVLALVAVGVFFALPKVLPVFLANLYLNAFILLVFLIGLFACFWQVVQIANSVGWISRFSRGEETGRGAPRLLAPLASLMRSRGPQGQIGSASARSILDSVATRIDEERDITRYITNLLIFLGLLGTFFGLATTIPAVVETIRSLAPGEGEGGVEVFERLMTGLEAQLGGMGTAFSSSLLGLAGSLVVGLLELLASHGQNRFYRELEEWLSEITKVAFAPSDDSSTEAGLSSYLLYMAEQMDGLRQTVAAAEEGRATSDARLWQLVDGVERLTVKLDEGVGDSAETSRLVAANERLAAAMEARASDGADPHGDAEAKMRLRSIDVQLLRVLEELAAGRQETTTDLRKEIRAMHETLKKLGGQG